VNTPIWYLLDEITQRKFRALASAEFKPPKDDFERIKMGESGIVGEAHIEDSEELEREMKKKPRGRFRANP